MCERNLLLSKAFDVTQKDSVQSFIAADEHLLTKDFPDQYGAYAATHTSCVVNLNFSRLFVEHLCSRTLLNPV